MISRFVLFLDDIQWADAGTLSLLPELVEWHPGSPVDHPGLSRRRNRCASSYSRETLDQHGCGAKNTTVPEMFCSPEIPAGRMLLQGSCRVLRMKLNRWRALITNQTEGVPLFINEWLRILYSQGAVELRRPITALGLGHHRNPIARNVRDRDSPDAQ